MGYCAENTLGWKIRNGDPEVNIFGDKHELRAQVEIMDSFSGHADHSELMDYFGAITGPKKKVWLVHGEPTRSAALAEAIGEKHDGEVEVAELGSEVSF